MESVGFKKNPMEWWHYDLPDASKYPLRDEPFSAAAPDAGKSFHPEIPGEIRADP